jgi:oligopeptide transport system substrate-binding protein
MRRSTYCWQWFGIRIIGISLLASGCRAGHHRSTAADATQSSSAAADTLHLAQVTEPTTFDPARVADLDTMGMLIQVFEGLVRWTSRNQLAPALAQSWEVSPDGRTYTFHLRPGVTFHSPAPGVPGRKLKASDFVYSLNRALWPQTRAPLAMTFLNDIVGAADVAAGKIKAAPGLVAPDDGTLKITIDKPRRYFLAELTTPPAFVVCREVIESHQGLLDETNAVGTGPFRLTEYRQGRRIVLERNAGYYEGAPKLARIEKAIVVDQGTRHSMFENGQLDIVDVNVADLVQDRKDPELAPRLHVIPRAEVRYAVLNSRVYLPFQDRRVRQAVCHAINKEEICRTVLAGVYEPAAGIIPPGIPGYDPHFAGLSYNLAEARWLLAAAGYPAGRGLPSLTLSLTAKDPDTKRVGEAVAEMLRSNLGLNVELRELEWGKFLQEMNHRNLGFYLIGWGAAYLDPQAFISINFHSKAQLNNGLYHNSQVDRLCEQADIEPDPAKRNALYRQAQAIIVTDAPWCPLAFEKDVELWSRRVEGVEDCLMYHLPYKRTTVMNGTNRG